MMTIHTNTLVFSRQDILNIRFSRRKVRLFYVKKLTGILKSKLNVKNSLRAINANVIPLCFMYICVCVYVWHSKIDNKGLEGLQTNTCKMLIKLSNTDIERANISLSTRKKRIKIYSNVFGTDRLHKTILNSDKRYNPGFIECN